MANANPDRTEIPDLLKLEAREAHRRIVEIGREVTIRAPGLGPAMDQVAHHASTMWAEGKPTSEAHSRLVLICSKITLDRFNEDIRFRMTEIIGQAAKIEALLGGTAAHAVAEAPENSMGRARWGQRMLASILSIGCASAAACGFHAQGLEVVSPMPEQVAAYEYGDFWVDQVPLGQDVTGPVWVDS